MKKLKKLLSVLLCLALCLGLFPAGIAFAEEPETETATEPEPVTEPETATAVGQEPLEMQSEPGGKTHISLVCVNPLYEGLVSADELNRAPETRAADVEALDLEEYSTDETQMIQLLRSALEQRNETIQFNYQMAGTSSDDVIDQSEEFWTRALMHTGVPTQGDYLLFQHCGYECNMSFYRVGEYYFVTFTYTVTYYTTAEQEKEMDTAAAAVISGLSLDGRSSYEKLSAIYGYICDNVVYDYAHLGDSTYKLQYTAYAALINKTAVCQGYAVLFYRLALMAGVDARVISGIANGGGHAWNIARIGNLYYNLDSTWDAGRSSSAYRYFLRCEENFTDHIRDGQYCTEPFNIIYPMAESDYAPGGEVEYPVFGPCGGNLSWTLDAEGTLTISGMGTMVDYDSGCTPWADYRENIKKLVIGSGVTSICRCAFSGCTALTEIVFQGDAPAMGEDCFAGVTATAFYPGNNNTWTGAVLQNYGGSITWANADTGYVLTGTAVSWDGNGGELICLYSGLTEEEVAADITAGAAGAGYRAQCGEAVQNADGKRFDTAFCFSGVEEGEYTLAVYKPGNYTLKTAVITVSANADLGTFELQLTGDISGDGKVNTMDLIRLMKYLSGENVELAPGSADITGDGKINTMDLIRLMKLINGEAA